MVRNHAKLGRVVITVPEKIDREVARLKLKANGVSIDRLESVRYYAGFPMSAHHVVSGVKAKLEVAA